MHLNARSLKSLTGVHPDLVKVVMRAAELTDIDFIVTEGLRTKERQAHLLDKGATKTMKSRHLTGHAIDFAPVIDGEVTWKWPPFGIIAGAFKRSANGLGVAIVWGGDWAKFKDGPHIELNRLRYP